MKWEMKEIEKVEIWNHPWFGSAYYESMAYEGNGVWAVVDYAWNVGSETQFDSRYYFVCTYTDGSVERWGHFEDDCRQSENADNVEGFYNIYRFNHSTLGDEWADSWKVHESQREGYNQLATFRVYMNNDETSDYYHTRSFRDK